MQNPKTCISVGFAIYFSLWYQVSFLLYEKEKKEDILWNFPN